MSINLNAKEVKLWQTPTWVTNVCYSNKDGGWEGILYRYEEWVKSRLQGEWENNQELNDMEAVVNDHLAKVHAAAKKHKKLTFYTL